MSETAARVLRDPALRRALWIGLALRALWALVVPVLPVSDGNAYHVFASNLALHGVFGWTPERPDAYWPPGAPFLYSLAYRALGISAVAVVLVNLALAAAKLALLGVVTADWFGMRAARLACLALALWPAQIAFTTVLSSENAFDVALLAAVACAGRGETPGRRALSALGVGLALAAASYVRPTALPLGVGLALIAAVRGMPLARCAALAAIASATIAVAIAPWALRNERVFGRTVLISANGGTNLWMGNNPASRGGYMPLPPGLEGLNTAERDAILGDAAKRWMAENPGAALALAARKLAITYGRETIGVAWNARALAPLGERGLAALKAFCTVYWWLALAAAATGVAVVAQASGVRGLLGCTPLGLSVYFALVHAITVGQDRYHLPAVPYLAALAGLAAARLISARDAEPPTRESAA